MSEGGSYDPKQVEPEIYDFWERGGYFHSDPDPNRKPFTIVIPPPNVTGALHLGHALNNTIQDILIRSKRMQGYNACWLPGTDHAGIATQAVVEKRLRQEEGKTRHEIGREGLVRKIWEWKEDYNNRILTQLRTMGCSCDWRRTRFTLDETCAAAVYEFFFRLFRDGLIFRGQRLVNWDTQLQTAVADDEVYHETVKSHLWHVRYPVLEDGADATDANACAHAIERASADGARIGRDYLMVATTRPETMLADVAIAVHPNDDRYKHLIGRRVLLPLVNKPIPVIADGVLVDPAFGTGAVKVTPGHDPNDYACGQRHGLPMPSMMQPDGKVAALEGIPEKYVGLSMESARKEVVADLEAAGLMDRIEPYQTEVGHSDRSKSPIQPMLSEQWFVRMDKLAEAAMEAVRDGRVRFFPERFAKSYLDWLGEKRDWCISRQLWWGHRIPVWTFQPGKPLEADVLRDALDELLRLEREGLVARQGPCPDAAYNTDALDGGARSLLILSHWTPTPTFQQQFSTLAADFGMEQDPDVLDTWFSSALWPFSTFGWPGGRVDSQAKGASSDSAQPSDLDYYYPTDVLSTARDIISLWVARMVMSGLYNLRRVPFPHVLIHPTIQDGQGRRMSKSLGNGVDPLDLIHMYGADGMRFTLASLAGDTQDIRIPVKPATMDDGRVVNTSDRFEAGRNFVNKLWQAATGFVFPNLKETGGDEPGTANGQKQTRALLTPLSREELPLEDRWILSRLSACIAEVDRRLSHYQISDVTDALYSFFWNDFCDWYVEMVKPRLYGDHAEDSSAAAARRVLAHVLDQTLRLMHPIMPFVTEKLWRMLNEAAPTRGAAVVATVAEDAVESPAPEKISPALVVAAWPDASAWPREPDIEEEMRHTQDVIRALREVRTTVNAL
ncbi:MAG: valine--tRNA ligase, partial [Planctomycetota bacterium]